MEKGKYCLQLKQVNEKWPALLRGDVKDLTFLYDQNETAYSDRNRFFDSVAALSSA